MSLRILGRMAGLLLVFGLLTMTLPGCGGGSDAQPGEAVEAIPPVNPAPGAMEDESNFE